MTDKPPKNDDKDLFRQAMRGVKPLTPTGKITNIPALEKTNTGYRRKQAQRPEAILKTTLSLPMDVDAETVLSYYQIGLSSRQWQNIKAGRVSIDAKLDLHGYNLDQALLRLEEFFNLARAESSRYVLIVHGKGSAAPQHKPLIKNAVLAFLKTRDDVVAFHSAPSSLGGTGAVIVLIKKL